MVHIISNNSLQNIIEDNNLPVDQLFSGYVYGTLKTYCGKPVWHLI